MNATFTVRFTDCPHTHELPLLALHSAGHVNCFVCNPELRDQPMKGKCPECTSRHEHRWKRNFDLPTTDFNPPIYAVTCDCGAQGRKEEGSDEVFDVRQPDAHHS